MGKPSHKAQIKLDRRISAMLATHQSILRNPRVNPKIQAAVTKAFKLPGSRNLRKK